MAARTNRKRKLPASFLDCQSLSHVVDLSYGQNSGDKDKSTSTVTTPVAADVSKEVFLDRLVKEVVKPFRPKASEDIGSSQKPPSISTPFVMANGKLQKRKQTKQRTTHENTVWGQRLRMGTNQCLRLLETRLQDGSKPNPTLLVLARDLYPPTMLAHAPAMAKSLNIPVLLLPGSATKDLGQALGIRRTSILLFLDKESSDHSSSTNDPIDSFVDFAKTLIPKEE
eukprot:Nitzschia sp. Nitz4//scaffold1_size375055//1462//2139//NITZ4_000200-RA/size375055-processed-gene-0.279-mRNA-1//1//CDS//3329540817//6308//frame0